MVKGTIHMYWSVTRNTNLFDLVCDYKLSLAHMLNDLFHTICYTVISILALTTGNHVYLISTKGARQEWLVSRGCLLPRCTWSYLRICRRSVLSYTRFCNCLWIMITFYTLLTSLFCIVKYHSDSNHKYSKVEIETNTRIPYRQYLCSCWREGLPTVCWRSHGYESCPIVSGPGSVFIWGGIYSKASTWEEKNILLQFDI
jgi:hypothetical protein